MCPGDRSGDQLGQARQEVIGATGRGPRAAGRMARRAVMTARWTALDGVAGVQRRVRSGAVALTFDDGPSPSSTPEVLDILGEQGVQATFFCVGRNARTHPELVKRM